MARPTNVRAMIHLIVVIAPVLVQARTGAFGRRFASMSKHVVEAAGSLQMMSPPKDAPTDPIVVKLDRVNVEKSHDPKGHFYVGHISIGQPEKELSVMFHTLSGHVIVPHVACKTLACHGRHSFSPWASGSAVDVNINGTAVTKGHRFAAGNVKREAVVLGYKDSALGEGEVKSLIVRDHVCLKSVHDSQGCVEMEVLAATSLPETPFGSMPNDGIVGLGFESLAASPKCSFFGRFVKEAKSKHMMHQFGITYGEVGGELHLGGHDETRFVPPLKWLPVEDPEDGLWRVAIKSVRVGNKVIDSCEHGCNGYIDSGASLLGVQASNLVAFKMALTSHIDKAGCHGSELIFDLGDETTLALPADDYTDSDCKPQLGPLHAEEKSVSSIYALGAPMLRRYYAAFDWDQKRIGFARSSGVLPTNSTLVPFDFSSKGFLKDKLAF